MLRMVVLTVVLWGCFICATDDAIRLWQCVMSNTGIYTHRTIELL